jgi:hypothetical protein
MITSVSAAIWLLTVSLGNAFVAMLAETKIFSLVPSYFLNSQFQTIEFFFYAFLMVLSTIVFIFLSRRYVRLAQQANQSQLSTDALLHNSKQLESPNLE